MARGQFDALQDDSSSSSSSSDDQQAVAAAANIPSYEDLSMSRADEETVLAAVYGEDFTRQNGAWGCPKLQVHVKPPPDEKVVGCELTLSVQLGKHYPYVVPTLELLNVKGLNKTEQESLLKQLKDRMVELAETGTVMVIELVQLAEDCVLEHNQDPTLSAWEQMKARQEKEQLEKEQLERQWLEPTSHSKQQQSLGLLSDDGRPRGDAASSDIQRELNRQREAIDAARQRQNPNGVLGRQTSSSTGENPLTAFYYADNEDDDDFDDAELEDDPQTASADEPGSSRYRTDFIELGVLGRGGGGEVVKVRNRLDRRTCKCMVGLLLRSSFLSHRHHRRHQKDHFGIRTRKVC